MTVAHANLSIQLGNQLRFLDQLNRAVIVHRDSTTATWHKPLIASGYSDALDVEATVKEALKATSTSITNTLQTLYSEQVAATTNAMTSILASETRGIPMTAKDLAGGAISYEYDQALAATGQISILNRRGWIGALRGQMAADSENVLENGVTFGAIAADSDNAGAAAFDVAPSGEDHVLNGVATLECVNDTVGYATFSLKNTLTTVLGNGDTIRQADRNVTIEQSYEDGPTGISLTLGYGDITETDPNNIISGTGDGIYVTNPNEQNTQKGIIFLKFTRQASNNFLIEWFNRSSRDPSEKVRGIVVNGVAGTASGTSMTGTNGMTVTFNYQKNGAAAAMAAVGDTDETVQIDINAPRIGDSWTFTCTNDEASDTATILAEAYPGSLPSGAAESANYPDGLASAISI